MFAIFKAVCISFFGIWLSSLIFTFLINSDVKYSSILLDRHDNLLAAKIATDGQWRFPTVTKIDSTYIECLLQFEDKRFFQHVGVDPLSLVRAIIQNITYRQIRSGASTITMQLSRNLLKHKKRNLQNKFIEIFLALGLELRYNKKQILEYYAQSAAYGGNTIGLASAKWRYYGKPNWQLSYAEAACLAVLPHQPSLIHVNKSRELLLIKRNNLLKKLFLKKIIDARVYQQSVLEDLPNRTLKLPINSNHVLNYLMKQNPNQYIFQSHINENIQNKVADKVLTNHAILNQNLISNIATLIIDNRNLEVISYIGNVPSLDLVNGNYVDMLQTKRSSGSVLKPILIACLLDKGLISSKSVIPDVPTQINGFSPENFDRNYSGLATIRDIIRQSLNIPSVKLLQAYSVDAFYIDLKNYGFKSLFRNAEDYGLSLILGGAEITPWELGRAYANFAKIVDDNANHRNYNMNIMDELKLIHEPFTFDKKPEHKINLSASSLSLMLSLMTNTYHNDIDYNHTYQHNESIAWKTGTSYGFKDAWCVGVTPKYTVVTWVGNSNGLSRPGLIGLHSAAPICFSIFELLNDKSKFLIPYDDMRMAKLCRQSGFAYGPYCVEVDSSYECVSTDHLPLCMYHKQFITDTTKHFQVFQSCEENCRRTNYYILPPVVEYYYRKLHPEFELLPPYRLDCVGQQSQIDKVDIIYPSAGTTIWITKDRDGSENKLVFRAVSLIPHSRLFWFIDNVWIGETNEEHKFSLSCTVGKHTLYITDEFGNNKKRFFEVVKK